MLFSYRPQQALILSLYAYFHTPDWSIPSNFPALARKLQDLQNGIQPNLVYSCEAPQERDIDLRTEVRKVGRTLARLSSHHQAILVAAYTVEATDERVERALTPLLAGLVQYSKWKPIESHLKDAKVMTAIRLELDEMWREAHRAFEAAYAS